MHQVDAYEFGPAYGHPAYAHNWRRRVYELSMADQRWLLLLDKLMRLGKDQSGHGRYEVFAHRIQDDPDGYAPLWFVGEFGPCPWETAARRAEEVFATFIARDSRVDRAAQNGQ